MIFSWKTLEPSMYIVLCLGHCSTAVMRLHDRGNSHKGKHLSGACLQFIGLFHYHHSREQEAMQAEVVENYILLHKQKASHSGPGVNFLKPSNRTPTDLFPLTQSHLLLQQSSTHSSYSDMATPTRVPPH